MACFSVMLCLLLTASCARTAFNHQQSTPSLSWQQAIARQAARFTPAEHQRLLPYFKRAGVVFPPKQIALLGFKAEQRLELWAQNSQHNWQFIKAYSLLAKSGELGPKMRMNDRQIPEGIYQINELNPYSQLHLSLRLNYPNAFDRYEARLDGRRALGNNIFIHGKAISAGCLAIGDKAIEELFVLVNQVGAEQVQVVIAPNDLRQQGPLTNMAREPRWLPRLYRKIANRLTQFSA